MNFLNLKISRCNSEQLSVFDIKAIDAINWTQLPAILEIDYLNFGGQEEYLLSFLSEQEKLRSFNYHRKNDALRFITGRAILRVVLGKLLNVNPSQLIIEQGENKKPVLKYPQAKLHFNVSHARSKVLIAVDKMPIGVDIENTENAVKVPLIGKKVLSIQEQLSIIQSQHQRQTFCLLWTRKEAFLKAIGKGIDDDIANIPSLDGSYKLWGLQTESNSDWLIQSFNSEAGYTFSLAYKSVNSVMANIQHYRLQEDFTF